MNFLQPLQAFRARRRRQAGLTLVELSITLAVLAILVGVAVPNFEQARELRRLEGAAAQLETDLQHTRALAVAHNETVRMSFEASANASCYVVHTGNVGDCSCVDGGLPVCQPGAQALRAVHFGSDLPLRVVSNSRSITFDPVKGTITPTATVRVLSRQGAAIHQVVNVMGRVRSCAPAPGLAGYRRC
jgi:type IV fimbrial biogenesis protein FimT